MQNCYNQGKIPREIQSEQDERLTRKHIQTLSFMQEIVCENKELKAKVELLEQKLSKCAELHKFAEESKERIKEIQETYLQKADDINAMLIEKHKVEILQKVEEHLTAEKAWNEERQQLKAEMERLQKEISRQAGELEDMEEHKSRGEILQLKVDTLHQEIDRLTAEKDSLHLACKDQIKHMDKIQELEELNANQNHIINELKQQIKELQIKNDKLEKELAELRQRAEQDELVITLKNKLTKLHKDKSLFQEREKEYESIIQELKDENAKLRRALNDSERMRGELQKQMEIVLEELSTLRKMSNGDKDRKQTFKDFVQLKRDVNILKDENYELKEKLKLANQHRILPSLKADTTQSNRQSHQGQGRAKPSTRKVSDVRRSSSDSGGSSGPPALTWK